MDAVIGVPKESRIFRLTDLRGRRLATPSALALGTLLVRERLATFDVNLATEINLVETPTHNASLMSMINKSTDAAIIMTPAFNRTAPKIRDQVRVLGKSTRTPHMPFCVAPWVSNDRARAFTSATVELKNSEAGRCLFEIDYPRLQEYADSVLTHDELT